MSDKYKEIIVEEDTPKKNDNTFISKLDVNGVEYSVKDAEGRELIAAETATRIAEDAKKVNITEENANGKSQFINENDGGGVFFIKNDGTSKTFIGVNDSSIGGPDAQIYAINPADSNKGSKIDITKDKIYYTANTTLPYSQRVVDANEIATLGTVTRVIDVIEYAKKDAFPETGETDKVYLALDEEKLYFWNGTTYAEYSCNTQYLYRLKRTGSEPDPESSNGSGKKEYTYYQYKIANVDGSDLEDITLVDETLSSTSKNPIQNGVITNALGTKATYDYVDSRLVTDDAIDILMAIEAVQPLTDNVGQILTDEDGKILVV